MLLVAVIKPIIVTLIDMTTFIINKLFRLSLFPCLLNIRKPEGKAMRGRTEGVLLLDYIIFSTRHVKDHTVEEQSGEGHNYLTTYPNECGGDKRSTGTTV